MRQNNMTTTMMFLLMGVLCCFCLSPTSAAAFIPPQSVDFSPFHQQIRLTLQTSKELNLVTSFDAKTSTSGDCSMPASSIMFTYTNTGAFQLAFQQHKSMTAWGLHACLRSRFIVVCLDEGCMAKCKQYNINNCVMLQMPPTPPSNFLQGAYTYLTWLKQDLIREALTVVKEAMFFDADVAIFRNPWIYTQSGREINGSRIHQNYDIMFQRDRGRGDSCEGTVNSGVLYVRNTTKTRKIFDLMLQHKACILDRSCGYEQDIMNFAKGRNVSNAAYCTLDANLFTHNCMVATFNNIRYNHPETPINKVVTYHTSCVDGLASKLRHMEGFDVQVRLSPQKQLTHALSEARNKKSAADH